MKIVDQFYNVPGTCWFTHSSNIEGPIIDTETFIEGRGQIYIGPQFLEEACRLIGWRHPEEVELVNAENEALKARVAELEAEVADKAALEAAISRAVAALGPQKVGPSYATPTTPAPFSPSGD